jgi:hypothetical protein
MARPEREKRYGSPVHGVLFPWFLTTHDDAVRMQRICALNVDKRKSPRCSSRSGTLRGRQSMMTKSLVLAGALALAIATPAQYNKIDPGNNNPPPAGAILDLSGTPIPGRGNNTYQMYSVDFTATMPTTAITFAFREDPSFIRLSNVSVTDVSLDNSVNLLVNGNFSQGVYSFNGNSFTPIGWTYANQYGATFGGEVVGGCGVGGGFCWDDGAVQAYDAISQTIPTIVGHQYQISFFVADGSGCSTEGAMPCNFSDLSTNGDSTNTGGNGINVTVYAQAGLPSAGGEGVTLTGTPIDAGNPESLTQTFHFGGGAGSGQENDYTFDYSNANAQHTLTIQPGTTPIITDTQITPANWPGMVFGTPFATTVCIPITGANGNCASKKQVCTTAALPTTPLGANCPQSSQTNILFSAVFDASAFPPGTIFGATEATDDWTGGACTFPAGEPENGKSCPQNTLKSFTGPGQYTGRRGADSTNSTGVIYTNLIPPTTTVTGFVNAAGWSNSANPMGTLTGNPPQLPSSNTNGMTDPPVASITYGVDNLPTDTSTLHPTDLPIAGDIVIPNPSPGICPATLTTQQQPSFGPNPVTLGPFGDGSTHQLHYFTTDCATTEELKFTKDAAGNWSTTFNSLTINIDTTNPTITGPALSAPNPSTPTTITATYTCNDAGSGIAQCGTHNPSPVSLGPPVRGQSSDTETDTLSNAVGPHSFAVHATDEAGNFADASANYYVYGICALYDQTKAVHSGATVPVKMYLCNGPTDLSSSSIVVHATGLFQMSSSTSDPVIDAGNANPDMDFRFDSTLGPSGGYIFNLKTSGLGSGNWVIQFTIAGDPTLHSLGFGVK